MAAAVAAIQLPAVPSASSGASSRVTVTASLWPGAEVDDIAAAAAVLAAVGGGVVDPADEHRLGVEQQGGLGSHGKGLQRKEKEQRCGGTADACSELGQALR
jgi:hypothetical protein